MIQDAGIRLKFINAILDTVDNVVKDSFHTICVDMAYENACLVDTVQPNMFSFRNCYYPEELGKANKLILSKRVSKLHLDLVPQFESVYVTYVKEYSQFRGKFKSMLSELCRYAINIDCFFSVLPDLLLKQTKELSYVAIKTATGISDVEDFKAKYEEVINKAVYYITIRQLI